jgi:ribosome-associated translation inhibitor RaiA
MVQDATVVIRFKDMANHESLRSALESRMYHLANEFPETTHFELTLEPEAGDISAHSHVSGRHTDLAAHARAADLQQAGERSIDKLERELRREHDKRIFGNRRSAQKTKAKRQPIGE